MEEVAEWSGAWAHNSNWSFCVRECVWLCVCVCMLWMQTSTSYPQQPSCLCDTMRAILGEGRGDDDPHTHTYTSLSTRLVYMLNRKYIYNILNSITHTHPHNLYLGYETSQNGERLGTCGGTTWSHNSGTITAHKLGTDLRKIACILYVVYVAYILCCLSLRQVSVIK